MNTYSSRSVSIFASMLLAGWLANFIAEIVTRAIIPASAIGAFVVVRVLTDLLAARFLPSFLRALAGLEVSVGNAFVALLAGTITTDVLMIGLSRVQRGTAVYAPGLTMAGIVPGLAGTCVSFFMLQAVVTAPWIRFRTRTVVRPNEDAGGVDEYDAALFAARRAIGDTCNLLSYREVVAKPSRRRGDFSRS